MSVTESVPHLESDLLQPEGSIDIPGILACLIITATLWYVLETIGIAIGIAASLTWFVLGTPYAIAVAHVLLAVVVDPTLTLETLAILEIGFIALILAAVLRARSSLQFVGVTLGTLAILALVGWITLEIQSLWLSVAVVLATLALMSYALHRLALVSLGKIEQEVAS